MQLELQRLGMHRLHQHKGQLDGTSQVYNAMADLWIFQAHLSSSNVSPGEHKDEIDRTRKVTRRLKHLFSDNLFTTDGGMSNHARGAHPREYAAWNIPGKGYEMVTPRQAAGMVVDALICPNSSW